MTKTQSKPVTSFSSPSSHLKKNNEKKKNKQKISKIFKAELSVHLYYIM